MPRTTHYFDPMLPANALLALVLAASHPASPPQDAAGLEQQMGSLQQQVVQQMSRKDWDGATSTIKEMAGLDPDHPKVYIRVVLLQRQQGKVDESVSMMDALDLPHGPGRLYGQGFVMVMQNKSSEALPMFSKALREYSVRGHLAGQAACHFAAGYVHKQAAMPDMAEKEFSAARILLERLHDDRGLEDVVNEIAGLQAARGRHDLALVMYRQTLELREKRGDKSAQAMSLNGVGVCLRELGKRDQAIEAFDHALEIRRELKDWAGEISSLSELAAVYSAPEDLDKAMGLLEEALSVAERVPDRPSQADVLLAQGRRLLAANHHREAVPPLENAAKLYKELSNSQQESIALGLQGLALNRTGEYGRARAVLERSVDRARALRAKDGGATMATSAESDALTYLGNAYLATGEPAKALAAEEQSLALSRDLHDQRKELAALNNLSLIYYAMGLLKPARTAIEEALKGYEVLHDRGSIARSRSNLGLLLAEEHRYNEALAQFRQAIAIRTSLKDRRGLAFTRTNQADTLLKLGRPKEAAPLLQTALGDARASEDREAEAHALNVLGDARLALGQTGPALEAHRQALEVATASGIADERWAAHAGIASVLDRTGPKSEAQQAGLQALDEVEQVRQRLGAGEFKMRFLASKIPLYESAIARLVPAKGGSVDPDTVARSFALAERARARALLDQLAESRSGMRDKVPAALKDREQETLDKLSSASTRLAQAETPEAQEAARSDIEGARGELASIQVEMARVSPRYAAVQYPRPLTLKEVQSHVLRDDEVLLEYFIGERRSWQWIVDARGASVRELDAPKAIGAKARALLTEATTPAPDPSGAKRDLDAASALSAAVLPASLPAGNRLLVVPDGPLQAVPFDALRIGGSYLLETREIAVVPSATVIGLLRDDPAPVAPDGFLGVGAPVAGAARGPGARADASLPYAAEELRSVGDKFPEEGRTLLIGKDATRSAVKGLSHERYRYILFATHGWIDADPRYSGLKLSPEAKEEKAGLLSTDDIVSLPLASEIVVLSACRSASGEALAGEGTIGMARAFLYAGSRSALASLWDVADRSTSMFMGAFYDKIRAGASASEALRQAKLGFLKSDRAARRRLHAWAPFVLVGDPGKSSAGPNRTASGTTNE